jgi:hypothetical protein
MTEPGPNGETRQRPPALPSGCAYCSGRMGAKAWMAVKHDDDCRRPREGEQVTMQALLCFDSECDWSQTYRHSVGSQGRGDAITAYRNHLAADHPRTTLADWCASCGHAKTTHVGSHRCGGLARVGPGDEHDGGDFAACRCDGFVPLTADQNGGFGSRGSG